MFRRHAAQLEQPEIRHLIDTERGVLVSIEISRPTDNICGCEGPVYRKIGEVLLDVLDPPADTVKE